MQFITSRDNDLIKYICKLNTGAAFRRSEGFFVAEGIKLCRDTAAVCPAEKVFYTALAAEKYPEVLQWSTNLYQISDSVAAKISQVQTPQGVFCLFKTPAHDIAQIDPKGRYIALDRVQDAGNVGAILRSAAAFGYDGAILSADSADAFGPKAYRSSMTGAVKLPVFVTEDMSAVLKQLTALGMQTVAARLEESVDISAFCPKAGFTLVVGNEGQGVSSEVAQACDISVRIPMAGSVESLNAAVAAGVLLWHYRKP
ncbi:MAG: RNA methyltransferase [Oscillospiraceae bacterium]|nr:RNA methyltransferase [Oscillospiraceae bacterium]